MMIDKELCFNGLKLSERKKRLINPIHANIVLWYS